MMENTAVRKGSELIYIRVLAADEMEPQSDGTMFAAYTARYPVPHKRSGSSSNLWYR